jgi:hypothetical protein
MAGRIRVQLRDALVQYMSFKFVIYKLQGFWNDKVKWSYVYINKAEHPTITSDHFSCHVSNIHNKYIHMINDFK